MPAPILRIPIDDKAFQEFLKAFNKYQEQVHEQSEVWKDVNEVIGAIGASGAAISAEIARQNKELIDYLEHTRELDEANQKRAEEEKRRAQEEVRRDKEAAHRDQEAIERRRKAIAQVREYSRAVADAAVGLGKWAVLGGGASVAAGALSLWGLDRVVAGVAGERRLSQGFGVSMGERQALGIGMQRYFDVNSVLENVANAQADPSQWALFRMMGIGTAGKTTAQVTQEAAVAAGRMFTADRGNLGLAQAQGLTSIFSPDDLRRLAAGYQSGELQQSVSQSNKIAAQVALRDDVGRKWQNFLIALDTASLRIKNTLIDKLTLLERNGDLDRIITKFGDLATEVLDRIDFRKLGDDLDKFTKYVESPEFQSVMHTVARDIAAISQKMVDGLDLLAKYIMGPQFHSNIVTFATDVELVAKKIEAALKLLGILPDTPPNPGGPAPSGIPNAGTAGLPSGRTGWAGLGMPRGPGSFAFEHQAEQWAGSQLESWGWTENQAKGVLANLEGESNLNPFAKGDYNLKTKQYDAYGIAQWHRDRQALYGSLFGHTMQSIKDPEQALREQLEFVQWELTSKDPRNHYKEAGDELRKLRSAFEAGYEVSMGYERPRGGAVTAAVRGAQATVSVEIRNQTGASVATTVNAAGGG